MNLQAAFGRQEDVKGFISDRIGNLTIRLSSVINAGGGDGCRGSADANVSMVRADAGACEVRRERRQSHGYAGDAHHASANAHDPSARDDARARGAP